MASKESEVRTRTWWLFSDRTRRASVVGYVLLALFFVIAIALLWPPPLSWVTFGLFANMAFLTAALVQYQQRTEVNPSGVRIAPYRREIPWAEVREVVVHESPRTPSVAVVLVNGQRLGLPGVPVSDRPVIEAMWKGADRGRERSA